MGSEMCIRDRLGGAREGARRMGVLRVVESSEGGVTSGIAEWCFAKIPYWHVLLAISGSPMRWNTCRDPGVDQNLTTT